MILKDTTAAMNLQALRPKQVKARETILDAMAKSDPAKASALKEKQSQLDQTISNLQKSREDLSAQRKEAARQKIERLKKEIEMLRMQAAADPKAAARMAARLSRELSAAVKEYAAAGGSGAAAPVSASAPTAAASEAAPGATDQAAAVDPAAEKTAEKTTEKAAAPATVLTAGQPVSEDDRKQAELKSRQEKEERDKFIESAREAAKKLKDIIEKLKLKAATEGKNGGEDLRNAQNTLSEVSRALNALSMGTPAGSVDIFV